MLYFLCQRLCSLGIVVSFCLQVTAQNTPDTTTYVIEQGSLTARLTNDVKLTTHTIAKTYIQPTKWKKKQWLHLVGALSITGAVMLVDEDISAFFSRNQRSSFDKIAHLGDELGQPRHHYPVMLAIFGSGILVKSAVLRDTGIMLFASYATSGMLQTLGKPFIGRARPETKKGAFAFRPFRVGKRDGAAHHSFPSGHTQIAVANAWILARQINPLGLKSLFYSVPLVVGIQRVYSQAHFASDVLLTSALSIACAEAVLRIYPALKKKLAEKQNRLTFAPSPTGMSMRLSF